MGMIFFGQYCFLLTHLRCELTRRFEGIKLPSFDASSSRTPSTLSPLTPDALTKLERQLDEESLAKAFQNHSTKDEPEEHAQSEIVEDELGSLATGWSTVESDMMTPVIETVVEEKPGFWSLLTGKQFVASRVPPDVPG